MEKNKLFTGPWNLTDLQTIEPNGLKVFSCFSCGGGSTMGYKLAGFEVLGCVEIDPEMMSIYKENHHPKHSYRMGVQEFKNIPDHELPKELFNLDVLDGSPPCSSFSMAGSREKEWGNKKKFREGQAEQVLDDLFFDYIEIAKKLQPKVVVAENVRGLIVGNARGYVKDIFRGFKEAGYDCQLFLLNAATMGVPQRRVRTFFIANKIKKKCDLSFLERPIPVKEAFFDLTDKGPSIEKYAIGREWLSLERGGQSKKYRSLIKVNPNSVSPTLTATASCVSAASIVHWESPRKFSNKEYFRLQSFPDDFSCLDAAYVCGMSVPPFMMQRIANQIAHQFFGKKELFL